MTIEELKEHKMNAIAILNEESEYETAKATEKAFDLLIWQEEIVEKFNSIPHTSFFLTPEEVQKLLESTT